MASSNTDISKKRHGTQNVISSITTSYTIDMVQFESREGQFHEERDKVKINKYVYFHCKFIALTLTVLHVLEKNIFYTTVVPVMNGHPRDQAKVSVHCRWPLVTGTDGQAGDAKYNTPCNTT